MSSGFTFATLTGERVLKSVSEMLGHAQPSTIVDYYLRTDKERMRDIHERCSPFAEHNVSALDISTE